jgi:hypothetical protein
VSTLDEMPDLPPTLREKLDEQVEVAPGVVKRFGDCTHDEVAGFLEASQEAMLNHGEIAELLERANAQGTAVPGELRERLDAADRGPKIIAVRNELRKLVAEPDE